MKVETLTDHLSTNTTSLLITFGEQVHSKYNWSVKIDNQ